MNIELITKCDMTW